MRIEGTYHLYVSIVHMVVVGLFIIKGALYDPTGMLSQQKGADYETCPLVIEVFNIRGNVDHHIEKPIGLKSSLW